MQKEMLFLNMPLSIHWIIETQTDCQNCDTVVKHTTVLLFTEVKKGGHNEK